jgi:hypothetical protein
MLPLYQKPRDQKQQQAHRTLVVMLSWLHLMLLPQKVQHRHQHRLDLAAGACSIHCCSLEPQVLVTLVAKWGKLVK